MLYWNTRDPASRDHPSSNPLTPFLLLPRLILLTSLPPPHSFFQFGWGPACWIYASEIPSARLRSLNVSLAAATQWLFNFVVARAVPTMLITVGSNGYG